MTNINTWLLQPGIVKKLQIALIISVCLNLTLVINKISPTKEKEASQKELKKETVIKEVSELEIKNFIKEYLNSFFSTGLVAQKFIEKHSSKNLYQNELQSQLEMRTNKDLKSNFNIYDFYIETETQTKFKVILVGIESFENKDYKQREITIILDIEKNEDHFTVNSIPKFEVKV
jgi:hypothetical protein